MSDATAHPAALSEEALIRQCRFERLRRSGPGGQHRNKVETAVRITHEPTGVRSEAVERRSQEANRRQALFRLRVLLAMEVRRPCGEPSELWRSRVKQGKIACRADHEDFPALLAETLDVLADVDDEPSEAAARLGCTTSQLVRFLNLEPKALERCNKRRIASGRRALHG